MSIAYQIGDWLANGETGLSSKCMACVALGAVPKRIHWPHDPGDFNRCLLLVESVPEVRQYFPTIRGLCEQWASLIDSWDELREMFVAEAGFNWSESNRAMKTYERMKELGL
jgi:hypothetical protein